ncbi:mitochondrial putative cytochrome c peroxidase [Rozella allomycis CSF55]|uniref:Peroxidase n=1 Tax=Rozella allomycis (strain CSF55) TaxID=988480 RepID=A0A075AR17_ROZAC|nr:Peroxidase domain-containing protein [Rozella allomycis CSF55]RKP20296.1 mitochondrial putative cytochrome c peroxidase [Rozella allomycis CSF55]|eukprot:EPZ32736.1 Peroxidase domain-containing protein [Rozella allomycis CSF55]
MSSNNYTAVENAIRSILKNNSYDDGSIAPVLVRLAWHASGTYDPRSPCPGGSNGATMRYAPESTDGANAGLEHARAFLEPIKKQFPWISYADLWTLAGVVAIEAMGGPKVRWTPGMSFNTIRSSGRQDYDPSTSRIKFAKIIPPNGRLPDAAQGQKHIRDVFYRMGFDDREIVALLGAHTIGRCHANRSGFEGPWTYTPTRFSNQYYVLLLKTSWDKKFLANGNMQYKDPEDELMMLPADIALILDPKFRTFVELYAKDKDTFYRDFSSAFSKLLELGVKRNQNKL